MGKKLFNLEVSVKVDEIATNKDKNITFLGGNSKKNLSEHMYGRLHWHLTGD